MSKFLKSLIRNPLIAIAVLAAAGSISNFESTPNVNYAIVTPVQGRLGMQVRWGNKAEKTFPKMVEAENKFINSSIKAEARRGINMRALRNYIIYSEMGYRFKDEIVGTKKSADATRDVMKEKFVNGQSVNDLLTGKMSKDDIKLVLDRIERHLDALNAKPVKETDLPEELRQKAPAQSREDEAPVAAEPAVPATTVQNINHNYYDRPGAAASVPPFDQNPEIHVQKPPVGAADQGAAFGGESTASGCAPSSNASTATMSDSEIESEIEEAGSTSESDVPSETSEASSIQVGNVSEDPLDEVYKFVLEDYLSAASAESKAKLATDPSARTQAIVRISAGLKNMALNFGGYDSTEQRKTKDAVLGYAFDAAVSRAVNDFAAAQ